MMEDSVTDSSLILVWPWPLEPRDDDDDDEPQCSGYCDVLEEVWAEMG